MPLWSDLTRRYSSQYVVDYISKSCGEGYFIEAHCITQQYIILSIEKTFPNLRDHLRSHRISEFHLITFLNGVGFLGKDLYSRWVKLMNERNNMAHNLIDNPSNIKKLSQQKKKDITKFLFDCIDAADDFFIGNLKKKGLRFELRDPQITHLVDISIKRARTLDPKWQESSKKQRKELVKKRLIATGIEIRAVG